MKNFSLLFLFLLLALSPALAQYPAAPDPVRYVTDLGSFLNEEEELLLERYLLEVYKQNEEQLQIIVVTVPNLQGQSIKEYANGLARSWGIGQKGKDNGLLILATKSERKTRIEVGYGLEGSFPDIFCQKVVDEQLVANFKQRKFFDGFAAAADALLEKGLYKRPSMQAIQSAEELIKAQENLQRKTQEMNEEDNPGPKTYDYTPSTPSRPKKTLLEPEAD